MYLLNVGKFINLNEKQEKFKCNKKVIEGITFQNLFSGVFLTARKMTKTLIRRWVRMTISLSLFVVEHLSLILLIYCSSSMWSHASKLALQNDKR